jgi:hypothetical protein
MELHEQDGILMLIRLSRRDWLVAGVALGMIKHAQEPPLGGGAAPGGAGGTLSGVDPVLVDGDKDNDTELVDRLNRAFHRALDAGKDVDDALLIACQAVGSRVFPSQLDISLTEDPPVIRGWKGLELGPQQTPAAAPGGAAPPPPPPPPPPMSPMPPM